MKVHEPLEHAAIPLFTPGHSFPHDSQFMGSEFLSTHSPLQSERGSGQLQIPSLHFSLMQSEFTKHSFPLMQDEHVSPPQSMSVSAPFFTPSEQVAGVQVLAEPSHTPLKQSEPTMHAFPSAQARQSPPPQSTSVSWPFTMLSEQVGAQVSTTTSVAASPMQPLLPETVR
jgi:hypothetical protein